MDPKPASSELKLTFAAFIVGTVLEAVAGALNQLQAGGVDKPIFHITLAVIGVILQVLPLLGYNRGRAAVKMAAIQMGAQTPEVKVGLPLDARPTPPGLTPSSLPPY